MTDLKSNKKRKGHPQVINPVGEFCLPITLPDDPEWVAAFINAVRKLSNRSTWDYDPTGDYIVLADRWHEIADMIQLAYQNGITCEAEICEDGSCTEISAFHPAISYFPNNPITQPDEEGVYASPPWITGAGFIGATGADAMIDIAAFLGASWETLGPTLLPSWTLNFDGAGEIDVQFLSTIQGGACWLYPDGNPLVGDLINLEYTDITSLFGIETLGELYEIIIQGDVDAFVITHSVTFETSGPHTLTAQYFPTAELFEPPFIGIGGGLRSIQLCGGATVEEDIVVPYTIALDGDSLNLLADGIVVSEIPKTTLQSFLDKWVDTAGDTMTGPLVMDAVTIGGDSTPVVQEIQADGVRVADWEINPGYMRMNIATNSFWYLRNLNAGGSEIQIRNSYLMLAGDRSYDTPPAVADIRMTGNTALNAVAIHQYSSGPIIGLYEATTLRAEISKAGRVSAVGYDGYDYSSTTWRKQFGLSGDWLTATDAIRQGIVKLHVSGYDGDYEVFTAEYGEDILTLPSIAFFGHTPNTRVPLEPVGLTGATQAMVDQLTAYGLLDFDIKYGTIPTSEPETVPEWRKCSSAHFFADSLVAMIEDVFTNLATITPEEFITALIETYNIPAVATHQMLLKFQYNYAYLSGILDDLTDPDAIADVLLDCNFDRACFYDWIDTTSGWLAQTAEIIKIVLDTAWDTLGAFWFALGQFVDHPSCTLLERPCEDAVIDFRFGTRQGTKITKGVLTQGVGVTEQLGSGTYGIFMEALFNSCLIKTVTIGYFGAGIPQTLQLWPYESDGMGGWTLLGVGYNKVPSIGHNTWTVNFPSSGYFVDRLAWDFENEGIDYGNYIEYIEITIG